MIFRNYPNSCIPIINIKLFFKKHLCLYVFKLDLKYSICAVVESKLLTKVIFQQGHIQWGGMILGLPSEYISVGYPH